MMQSDKNLPQDTLRAWPRRRKVGVSMGVIVLAAISVFWVIGSGPSMADQPAAKPNQALIERGAYLAAAGDCVACHTSSDGIAFAGGRPLSTPFGSIYSANITGDPVAGIGNWSEQAFHRALTRGVSQDGNHIYPACPYPSFGIVSAVDSAAIQSFLLTRPVSPTPKPENVMSFPFSLRQLVGFWKLLFLDSPSADQMRLSQASGGVERGQYLVDGLGHCAGCHAALNIAGAYDSGLAMTGGSRPEVSALRGVHDSFAPSLLNEPAGLAGWSRQDIAQFLQIGRANGRGSATGAMSEVIEKSTQYLSESDRLAMADYLLSLKPKGRAASALKLAPISALEVGEAIYAGQCASCHGEAGQGRALAYAALAKSPAVNSRDPASLIYVTLYGAQAPVTAHNSWSRQMPGYQVALNDAEIAHLLTYIRQSWGNVGSPVAAEQVADVRQKTALIKPVTGTGNINASRRAAPPPKGP